MSPEPENDWRTYADDCYQAGKSIVERANIWKTHISGDDPRLIAVLLLIRTLWNFNGAVVLAGMKMTVEARILTRCCFENLFTVVALSEQGPGFVQKMVDADEADRRRRGEFLLESAPGPRDDDEVFKAMLRTLKSKDRGLNPRNVAGLGPLKKGYAFYAQLSADSGHPTMAALNRYLKPGALGEKSGLAVHLDPVDDSEILETIELACTALIGVSVNANAVLGEQDHPELGRLIAKMNKRAMPETNRG